MRKHIRDDLRLCDVNSLHGDLYSVYIFKERKWVKIGKYCTVCGIMLDPEYKRVSKS